MATAMTAATAQDRTGAGASRVRTGQDRPDAMQLVVMRRLSLNVRPSHSVNEKD